MVDDALDTDRTLRANIFTIITGHIKTNGGFTLDEKMMTDAIADPVNNF